MFSPIHLRAYSSKLPVSINHLVRMFHGAVAMTPISDFGVIKTCVALVCRTYLKVDIDLSLRHPLVSGGTKQMLGVHEWVC
jgi:hypothetical protein